MAIIGAASVAPRKTAILPEGGRDFLRRREQLVAAHLADELPDRFWCPGGIGAAGRDRRGSHHSCSIGTNDGMRSPPPYPSRR